MSFVVTLARRRRRHGRREGREPRRAGPGRRRGAARVRGHRRGVRRRHGRDRPGGALRAEVSRRCTRPTWRGSPRRPPGCARWSRAAPLPAEVAAAISEAYAALSGCDGAGGAGSGRGRRGALVGDGRGQRRRVVRRAAGHLPGRAAARAAVLEHVAPLLGVPVQRRVGRLPAPPRPARGRSVDGRRRAAHGRAARRRRDVHPVPGHRRPFGGGDRGHLGPRLGARLRRRDAGLVGHQQDHRRDHRPPRLPQGQDPSLHPERGRGSAVPRRGLPRRRRRARIVRHPARPARRALPDRRRDPRPRRRRPPRRGALRHAAGHRVGGARRRRPSRGAGSCCCSPGRRPSGRRARPARPARRSPARPTTCSPCSGSRTDGPDQRRRRGHPGAARLAAV